MTEGLLVLVQLVIAAMTTAPWPISDEWPLSLTVAFCGEGLVVEAEAAFGDGRGERPCATISFIAASGTRSCGRLGPASEGSTVAKVERDGLGEESARACVGAEQALLFAVALDQLDFVLRAAGRAQVVERFGIDREEADRRAVFGGHVADRRAVGERHAADAGAVELDELIDDACPCGEFG